MRYALHALSIDENREKFDCVPWDDEDTRQALADRTRDVPRFKQVWFAGSHSDVGGSYPETESRLSDIALDWMVQEATSLPAPIRIDASVLKLYPDSRGTQHDERKAFVSACPAWLTRCALWFIDHRDFGWREGHRQVPPDAHLHPSVHERFQFSGVLVHGDIVPYRPRALRKHPAVSGYWPKANGARHAAPLRRDARDQTESRPAPDWAARSSM